MDLTKKHITSIFARLKRGARLYYSLGWYNMCLQWIKAAGWWAYYFNVCFGDDYLEQLSKDLSHSIKTSNKYNGKSDKVVFYDSFMLSNRGLTQQYLRALMTQGKQILFITDAHKGASESIEIAEELDSYESSQIVYIQPELKGLCRSQFIYDIIVEYQPTALFMHLMPDAIEAICAFHALPKEIVRYQINLTDHTFWLGASVLDYSFEFRPYGAKVSVQYRHISVDKILLCPYYPIVSNIPFQGFPFESQENDMIIFSGGSLYKFSDEKHTFANMVKRILDENESAKWVFAGFDFEQAQAVFPEICVPKYVHRVFFIGNRKDIAEVTRHIDIFVNSYPMGGGLMMMYAALYNKPILLLKGSGEDILNQLKAIDVISSSPDELCIVAKKLIENRKSQEELGDKIHSCVVTKDLFNDIFNNLCLTHKNVLPLDCTREVKLPDMHKKIEYARTHDECRLRVCGILKLRLIPVSCYFWSPLLEKTQRKIKRLLHK